MSEIETTVKYQTYSNERDEIYAVVEMEPGKVFIKKYVTFPGNAANFVPPYGEKIVKVLRVVEIRSYYFVR